MTTHKEFYYILTFNTTTDAMCADKCAKENTNDIRAALMPLPQEFKVAVASCFVSWTIIWRRL